MLEDFTSGTANPETFKRGVCFFMLMISLSELRKKNIELAKRAVKASVNDDLFIINASNNIEELQKTSNVLIRRLREWYALYAPELNHKIQENEVLLTLIINNSRKDLFNKYNISDSMGADLKQENLSPILSLARSINKLIDEEKALEEYLEAVMKRHCPNIVAITGSLIGGKLLAGAGSLKKLAFMRSSTIQLLGAEKALFRHIKTGARSPKYGYLLQHNLVQRAKKNDKGRVARILADKLFIAARVDYFKGEFVGDKLLKEVEEKIK